MMLDNSGLACDFLQSSCTTYSLHLISTQFKTEVVIISRKRKTDFLNMNKSNKPSTSTRRKTKTNIFFCLSAFVIALFSVSLALSTESFLFFLGRVASQASRGHRLHLHNTKQITGCDGNKWKSRIVSQYNVSTVLTVDMKGCANFSSIQKSVDSIPDNLSTRTLILIGPGVYRFEILITKPTSVIDAINLNPQVILSILNDF